MRRTAVRRPIRLTESKLRQIIRSVIKENAGMPDELDTHAFDSIHLDRYDSKKIDWSSMDAGDLIRYPKEAPKQTQALINACVNSNQQDLRSFFQELVNEFQVSSKMSGSPSDEEVAIDLEREKVIAAMIRLVGGTP